MILARAWGCTPAQLREHTLVELEAMTEHLLDEQERREANG